MLYFFSGGKILNLRALEFPVVNWLIDLVLETPMRFSRGRI